MTGVDEAPEFFQNAPSPTWRDPGFMLGTPALKLQSGMSNKKKRFWWATFTRGKFLWVEFYGWKGPKRVIP